MRTNLIELGAIIRKRQTAQTMKRLEPEIKGIREEYDRQIAERDAEIARLHALVAEQEENEALKREIAMFKDEIATLKGKQAEPKPAAPRRGRKK